MFLWLVLLAVIIFFIYWWGVSIRPASGGSGCNTCPKRKNTQPVE